MLDFFFGLVVGLLIGVNLVYNETVVSRSLAWIKAKVKSLRPGKDKN